MHLHHEIFGRHIEIGSYVLSYDHNSLNMFVVEKLNPKMVGIKKIKTHRRVLRYPRDLMVVDSTSAVYKLLRDAG